MCLCNRRAKDPNNSLTSCNRLLLIVSTTQIITFSLNRTQTGRRIKDRRVLAAQHERVKNTLKTSRWDRNNPDNNQTRHKEIVPHLFMANFRRLSCYQQCCKVKSKMCELTKARNTLSSAQRENKLHHVALSVCLSFQRHNVLHSDCSAPDLQLWSKGRFRKVCTAGCYLKHIK